MLLLCILSLVFGGSIVEPQTKHSFSDNDSGLTLAGVGVRVKQIGPIKAKVYAGIGMIYFFFRVESLIYSLSWILCR